MLFVVIVDVHGGDIFARVGQVVQVVVCILAVEHQTVVGVEIFAEGALYKYVGIPLTVFVYIFSGVAYGGSRQSPFGVVQVGFGLPIAVFDVAPNTVFHSERVDVAVATRVGDIVSAFFAEPELVFAVRVHVFGAKRTDDVFVPPVFDEHRRVGKSERTGLEGSFQMQLLAVFQNRPTGTHINRVGRAEVFGRLEDVTFLSVV